MLYHARSLPCASIDVRFSDDGELVAVIELVQSVLSHIQSIVTVYHASSAVVVRKFVHAHDRYPRTEERREALSVALSRTALATIERGGRRHPPTLLVRDVASGETLVRDSLSQIFAVAVSSDGRTLAYAKPRPDEEETANTSDIVVRGPARGEVVV